MADAGNGSTVTVACLEGGFVVALERGTPVCCGEMVAEANHRIAVDRIGHKTSHRPKHCCCGSSVVQSVPGHQEVLPVGLGRCGGALGWLQRAKVSMMIICPPQHGQVV